MQYLIASFERSTTFCGAPATYQTWVIPSTDLWSLDFLIFDLSGLFDLWSLTPFFGWSLNSIFIFSPQIRKPEMSLQASKKANCSKCSPPTRRSSRTVPLISLTVRWAKNGCDYDPERTIVSLLFLISMYSLDIVARERLPFLNPAGHCNCRSSKRISARKCHQVLQQWWAWQFADTCARTGTTQQISRFHSVDNQYVVR